MLIYLRRNTHFLAVARFLLSLKILIFGDCRSFSNLEIQFLDSFLLWVWERIIVKLILWQTTEASTKTHSMDWIIGVYMEKRAFCNFSLQREMEGTVEGDAVKGPQVENLLD